MRLKLYKYYLAAKLLLTFRSRLYADTSVQIYYFASELFSRVLRSFSMIKFRSDYIQLTTLTNILIIILIALSNVYTRIVS